MNTELSEHDWNFDNVPNRELVACCYWEYARESAFIRGLRQRCWEYWRPRFYTAGWQSEPEEQQIHEDLQKVQSIGYPSEVFLRGFSCPPAGVLPDAPPLKPGEAHRLTGSFPKPWQELSGPERENRSDIGTDVKRIPLVPFQRGSSLDAKDIIESVQSRRNAVETENDRVRKENPTFSEEALLQTGKLKYPNIPASLFWLSGLEMTVVGINWSSFTNDKIVQYFRQWVRKNRPKDMPGPNNQGRKVGDWRAYLTRLAVMRLLSRHKAAEIVNDPKNRFAAVWKANQFSGDKCADVNKWHDARREAARFFRKLFPILPPDEQPLSFKQQFTAE